MARLRIGTWNLENLFKPAPDSGAPTDTTAYDAKLAALSSTITALQPHVMAVQEVGDPEALDDLAARLPGTWHTATAPPDDRGIRCGVLSRLKILESEPFSDFPTGLGPVQVNDAGKSLTAIGRPGLRVRVPWSTHLDAAGHGRLLDVVSVHLKSKLLTFPGGRFAPLDEDERARFAVYALHRRAAEAAGVRAFTTALLAGHGDQRRVIVAGDLNDEANAATTQILLGPPGSEIGTGGFDHPDHGDLQRLWNVTALIPEKERYSRVYRTRHELIDHLMVSRALLDDVRTVLAGGPAPSVDDDPRDRVDAPGSDHRPVLASFAI